MISSGVLIRLSRYSKKNARPKARKLPADERQRQVQGLPGRHRGSRPFGLVDDPDVAGLELGADAGLLRALQQALVELLRALDVALEHAVIDRLAVHRLRLALLLVERGDQAVLLGERRLVFVAHRLHDLGHLAVQLGLGHRDAGPHLDDVRVLFAELLRQLRVLALQLRQLRLLLLDVGVAEDRREAVERRGFCVSDCSCLYNASFWNRSVFACVTAAFRSESFWTTMFSRSSSEIASFCSRYRCSAVSACSTCLRCSARRSPSQSLAPFDVTNLYSRSCSM